MPLDSSKRLWLNDVERDAFIEETCGRCFQPDEALKRLTGEGPGCPHLVRAAENKKPKAWTRRQGQHAVIGKTYRCDDFMDKPAVNRRGKAPADTPPMFADMPSMDKSLVPVDGWPDYASLERQRKNQKDDHA